MGSAVDQKTCHTSRSSIRRVAIVGAGPTGIATAKYLMGEQHFERIDVYEQQASFGGAWIHSQPRSSDTCPVPQTSPFAALDKVHVDADDYENTLNGAETEVKPPGSGKTPVVTTPMYDNLETNIPHVLMRFTGRDFPPEVPLFPSRKVVLQYIEEYGQDIRHLVRFEHQVHSIRLQRASAGGDLWQLTHKNVRTGAEEVAKYDAIALANGHFALPNIPAVPGMRKWAEANPGVIMHSKFFRNPEDFRSKKVVVVGNASSGIDIGSQIATVCKPPIIISARSEPMFKMPSFVKHLEVPSIAEFIDPSQASRAIRFQDGRIEENVDAVVISTGYFFSFPFLDLETQKDLVNTGYMVTGTYKHMFCIERPSLAFMQLLNKVLPLPLGEAQACALARVWSGRLALPPKAQMRIWEFERWRTQAEMLKNKGKEVSVATLEKAFHTLGYPHDMDYHNEMITWAATACNGVGRPLPQVWGEKEKWYRSQMATVKKAFADLQDRKHSIKTLEELGFDFQKHQGEQAEQEKKAEVLHGTNEI